MDIAAAKWTGHDHWQCTACVAALEALEEAQLAYRVASTMLDEVVVERDEAQGKLEEIQALTLEPGHAVVDHITWHNALHRILRGSKEDE